MRYVRSQPASAFQRILIATICVYAGTAQPAHGAEGDAVVGAYALTDEEISQRCAASIAGKIDMVDRPNENGLPGKAPRCVTTYENMRAVAQSYDAAEQTARNEIMSVSQIDCTTQANCVGAGNTIDQKALSAHESMMNAAGEGQVALSSITGNKVLLGNDEETIASPRTGDQTIAPPPAAFAANQGESNHSDSTMNGRAPASGNQIGSDDPTISPVACAANAIGCKVYAPSQGSIPSRDDMAKAVGQ
ncbi:MAG: hypothetical protein AB7K68_17200 [Bacteriovoracia bacterium]